jgi:hypothetical protein
MLVLEADRQVLVLENATQKVETPLAVQVGCVLLEGTLDVLGIVAETKKIVKGCLNTVL